jgi:hypothetical protein
VATIFRGISREATPLLHVSTIFRGISREATPLLHVATIFTAFPVWQRRLQVFSFFSPPPRILSCINLSIDLVDFINLIIISSIFSARRKMYSLYSLCLKRTKNRDRPRN